jgi:hypothetical protein
MTNTSITACAAAAAAATFLQYVMFNSITRGATSACMCVCGSVTHTSHDTSHSCPEHHRKLLLSYTAVHAWQFTHTHTLCQQLIISSLTA